ncbi:MAG: pyruvate ferredoxin oxidoreductase, partial [Planctomycetes bacterium]|nr:pyruvate ferredoxin oxidoreductase [Planctomycetota bacterium]
MGTTASTAKTAVDAARARGVKAGALRVRMFRPFPEDLLSTWLRGRERVAVLDRDICPGLGGILWSELRGVKPDGIVQNYMLGLGGGDIRPEHLGGVLDDLLARKTAGDPQIVEVA